MSRSPAIVSNPDEDKGPLFLTLFSVGLAVAIIVVALRLWVRIKLVKKTGADDWVMLASMIVTTAAYGCLATSVHLGLGHHLADIPLENIDSCLKIFWAAMFMTPSAEAFAKFSISLMLIRITTNRIVAAFLYTCIGLFAAVTVVTLFSDTLQCVPLAVLYNPLVKGTCNRGAEIATAYLQGVGAALYDVILATIPIYILWSVQIDTKQKVALCALLGLGYLTCIAGILRTVYTPGALELADFTWTVMDFLIWKAVELPLSIIVGCLPVLRPLILQARQAITSRRRTTDHYQLDDSNALVKAGIRSGVSQRSASGAGGGGDLDFVRSGGGGGRDRQYDSSAAVIAGGPKRMSKGYIKQTSEYTVVSYSKDDASSA
ncbi:hypothetical protein MMC25_006768 [Agyrium rufum]|nr:hypothetical protein [Agyrium rufum]